MLSNQINISDILKARENRRFFRINLAKKYELKRKNGSIIFFTLNIPGNIKDNSLYRKIFDAGYIALLKKIEDSEIFDAGKRYLNTGAEGFVCLNLSPKEVKKMMVTIEETHSFGRIFDIDVFNYKCKQMSREELGYKKRKCIICDNDAIICSKTKAHSIEELRLAIKKIGRE